MLRAKSWRNAVPIILAVLGLETCFWTLPRLGLSRDVPSLVGLMILSHILYLFACWRGADRRVVLGAALVFRLTMGMAEPGLSEDVQRYQWEGKVQAQGLNPYLLKPGEDVPGRGFRAGYGPLVELEEWAAYRLVGWRDAFWMKLPAVAFELGTLALVSGMPTGRLIWYAWSPVPIVEFWWNGHNDALAVFFVVAALVAARREWWEVAFACLGLGIASKWWPAVLWPLFAWRKWRWSWVTPAVVVVTALPYLNVPVEAFTENARFLSGFVGGWRNNESLFGILYWMIGDPYRTKYAAFALIGIAVLYVLRWPLERACLGAITAMLLVSSNCHPWYLSWLVALLPFEPWLPVALWAALMPLAYRVLIGWWALREWDGSTEERWWIYVPVLGWMGAWAIWRKR